jgi:salicylate hydroxylase
MGPGRHLVSYPVRDGAMVNLVAVEERSDWAPEGWNHRDDPRNLQDAFAGFGGMAGDLLGRVEEASLWGLHLHPVAARWVDGNVALLGDAAHPTLPFLAQGANMALEDAWALAQALSAPGAKGLQEYQTRRKKRVSRVIRASAGNAWRYHLRPGPVRSAAHVALRLTSRFAPGRLVSAYDWLYGYDVTAAP